MKIFKELKKRLKKRKYLKNADIVVGTRVKVKEEDIHKYSAKDLFGMNWGTVIEIDEDVDAYLVKPDNCSIPNHKIAGWVGRDSFTEIINL